MKKTQAGQVLIACSQQVDGVPEVIRLLPLGYVSSQKGDFTVDEESFTAMCKDMAAHGIDIVIDYEHQTLKDVQAPAGGWIKELSLSDGAICGRVEWTPKATEYLQNREYRYLSPVVLVRDTDRKALRLKSVALTNAPAIDNMFPIINSNKGEDTMELLQQLAQLLGLPETATPEEILAAITAQAGEIETLKAAQATEVVANKTVLSLLSCKENATTAEVTAKIASLQNPANFVPVEQYNLIANKLNAQESTGLVELALKDGKITPAQKEWAQTYAKNDPTGFNDFLANAMPVVPMQQLALSYKPGVRAEAIPEEISRQLGLSAETINKYGKDEQ